MKLMTYNILDGAVNTLPQIIKIINTECPDFLTLNEANTFADNNTKILKQFLKATGFRYFDIALSGEYDYHVAIFSKYPLIKVTNIHPLDRACLINVVDSPLGLLSIASIHLTPYSEDRRLPEINLILDVQKEYQNKILMGDMNSLSKYDNYKENIITSFNETQTKKFTTDGKLRFSVIDMIIAGGYCDAAVELKKNSEPTVPTPVNNDVAHSKMRLDYVFISKPLLQHLASYSVIKNTLTDTASDHYPITAELY